MQKRLLIGLAAAGIVGGGTFGFAATLDVTSADLGAGNELVASCDDVVDVDYTVAWDTTDLQYEVEDVIVSGIAAACDLDDIRVTLTDSGDVSLGEADRQEMPAGGSQTLDVSDDDVSAEAVENVHVVISGD